MWVFMGVGACVCVGGFVCVLAYVARVCGCMAVGACLGA